jgi:hypothetical protein
MLPLRHGIRGALPKFRMTPRAASSNSLFARLGVKRVDKSVRQRLHLVCAVLMGIYV